MTHPLPSFENGYWAEHAMLLLNSYARHLGMPLLPSQGSDLDNARNLFHSEIVVLSHNCLPDPILTYGNLAALQLWETSWNALTAMPSRLTAEPENREKRAEILASISDLGFIDNYTGVRVSQTGKRFRIENAVIWTLRDSDEKMIGQAACFRKYTHL